MQSDRYVSDPQGARIFANLAAAHRMVTYLKEQEELTDAAVYRGRSGYFIQATDPQSGQRWPLSIDGFLEPLPFA